MKTAAALRRDAARIWRAALAAVDAETAVRGVVRRRGGKLQIGRRRFDLGEAGNLWVLGAGKGAAPMARAMERILGERIAGGLVVTPYGHALPLGRLEVLEAGHPLPDAASRRAAARVAAFARERVGPGDLVFCLLSGGASALLAAPAGGITLRDKRECTRLLMNAGADIHELNALRKHLSDIKGGRLARMLHPARVVTLALSDVVGDDPGAVASGPLSPDPTTFGDCVGVLRRYRLLERVPPPVVRRLERGAAGEIAETPKPGDPVFARCHWVLVGRGGDACAAAARRARRLGYRTAVITSRLEGDTGEAARFHMSIAEEIARERRPLGRPACVISGGETTVRVTGRGKGGRNQEFVLCSVGALARMPAPALVASLGTDGSDGPTDAAGAVADNDTLSRSRRLGADLAAALRDNDSHTFFRRLGDLVLTGPTRTNVGDLHIVLVG